MNERAYLCPVIETASELTGGRSFAAKLPDLPEGTAVSCSIPCSKDGVPLYSHALVIVKTSDFAALDGFKEAEELQTVPEKRDSEEVAKLMAERKAVDRG